MISVSGFKICRDSELIGSRVRADVANSKRRKIKGLVDRWCMGLGFSARSLNPKPYRST